jgi:hypothetical protein
LRGIVLQHMAVKLVVPAIHEQIRAFAAFVVVAPWNVAALVTQSDVVIAVVLGTSEPASDAIFRFVKGETTQLGKSWYPISYLSAAGRCQGHNVRFWCLLATLPLVFSSSRS